MTRRPPATTADTAITPPDALSDEENGAVQIGPTDQGMVRLILTTHDGVYELDFPPEEARDIAEEILASVEIAAKGGRRRS